MIHKIILTNFQRHKKLSLILGDGFNSVWGENQRGKSSIVRAIYWMLNNAPAGDWMRRRDKGGKLHTSIVKFIMKNGDVIKRVKGGGRNYYALNDQEFNDIGRKIPAEIVTALGIVNAMGGIGLDPHIVTDEDPPFLVREKPTVKSGALNVLTGVNTIEKVIKEFNKDKLSESRNIRHCEEEIAMQEEELARYDGLEDLDIEPCNKMMASVKKLQSEVDDLTLAKRKHTEKLAVVNRYKYFKTSTFDLGFVERLIGSIKVDRVCLSNLESAAIRVERHKKFCKPPVFDFDGIGSVLDTIRGLDADLARLRKTKSTVRDLQATIDRESALMSDIDKKIVGMSCPTCGQVLKKNVWGKI